MKFSFERYRGTSHELIKDRVAAVDIADPRHVRFRLKKPWPDFLTFYATASGAGWIVPKKYVEQVGDDGFKKAPIGAGPYKFVSFNPGVELVLEAFDQYWRKPPSVKRLVMKVIPDESTRLAALKRGEVDIAYSIRGELAEELKRSPGLTLKPIVLQASNWVYFPEQWDPKSPWHDLRVRQAANLALDRDGMNQALFLGHCKITNSIVPDSFDYYWQPPAAVYDPAEGEEAAGGGRLPQRLRRRAVLLRQLLREHVRSHRSTTCSKLASGPSCGRSSASPSSPVTPARSSPAAFCAGRAAPLATRRPGSPLLSSRTAPMPMAAIPTSTSCSRQQANELDREKRTAILEKIQQLVHEQGDLRADLAAWLSQWCRAAGRAVRVWADPWFRLYGTF